MRRDLVRLARERVDDSPRTHWEGCEASHRECLIQRLADELERTREQARLATVDEAIARGEWEEARALLAECRASVARAAADEAAVTWSAEDRPLGALLARLDAALREE